jgi:cyclohexa-1,5-dienecarbonyl-CoA hydratase
MVTPVGAGGGRAETHAAPDCVRLERSGASVRLVLARPPLNVLHIPMLDELERALAAVAADDSVGVVTLTGAGGAFCAGVDVADHTPERVGRMLGSFHAAIRHLLALECPVIAAVNGAALGGGCELLLACDIVLAREDAKIGQPEIRLGAFPPVAAVLLPRLIGRQRALELLLTGRVLSAAEAHDLGLVTETVPADGFDAAVEGYVRRFLGLSGPVLRLAKRAVLAVEGLPPAAAIERAEDIYLDQLMQLDDAREGVVAFLEKRPPVWSRA